MAEIDVTRKNDETYEVIVKAGQTTTHTVELDPDYYQKLSAGKVSPEELIRKSFEFLLERESNTMILSKFHLSVISRYFSDYEGKIAQYF